jgi:hypothetical protein
VRVAVDGGGLVSQEVTEGYADTFLGLEQERAVMEEAGRLEGLSIRLDFWFGIWRSGSN